MLARGERELSASNRDNHLMPPEPTRKPPTAPTPPTVTPEDLGRFDDEDQLREASNDAWLRAQQPPHHQ